MAKINEIIKALSDNTRRDILSTLRKKGKMAAGDIAANYEMTQATVSHHLSILLKAELIIAYKEGKYIIYDANMTVLQEALEWFTALIYRKGDSKKENPNKDDNKKKKSKKENKRKGGSKDGK